jgi:hypothetical protein
MTEKTEPSFEEAVAADWKNAYAQDISNMGPVQKHALQAAWREVESKNTDKSQDFERKIARMGSSEFNNLVADLTYDAQRPTSKMK